jgi:hypothetical protein
MIVTHIEVGTCISDIKIISKIHAVFTKVFECNMLMKGAVILEMEMYNKIINASKGTTTTIFL